jgi:predicted HTH domain antitoxin
MGTEQWIEGEWPMPISFQIPAELEVGLAAQLGDLNRAAKEAFAIQSYRSGKISVGVVTQLLGLESRWDTDRWLKDHDIPVPLTNDDLEADRQALDQILGPVY